MPKHLLPGIDEVIFLKGPTHTLAYSKRSGKSHDSFSRRVVLSYVPSEATVHSLVRETVWAGPSSKACSINRTGFILCVFHCPQNDSFLRTRNSHVTSLRARKTWHLGSEACASFHGVNTPAVADFYKCDVTERGVAKRHAAAPPLHQPEVTPKGTDKSKMQ